MLDTCINTTCTDLPEEVKLVGRQASTPFLVDPVPKTGPAETRT